MVDLGNLLAELPDATVAELTQTLAHSAHCRIERIVSRGQASPEGFWYDQDQHEWVLLVAGAARLQFESRTMELGPGDFVSIPAHKKHRVAWTDPTATTVWLAVFYDSSSAIR